MSATFPPKLIVSGQLGTANWVSPWVDRQKWHLLTWNPQWDATGGPTGTFSLEGTNDPAVVGDSSFVSASLFAFPLSNVTVFHGTWPTLAGVAGRAGVATSEGFAFERLKYTAANGAGSLFSVYIFGRQQ